MVRAIRIIFFAVLILTPFVFYKTFEKGDKSAKKMPFMHLQVQKPKIALIFDDLGESLKEIKDLYSLDIPLTASIIPGLKFSRNIAYISSQCGYSVFIHLPLEPKDEAYPNVKNLKFIGSALSKNEIDALLRYYFNYIRTAIGVNNHMGSKATEDENVMRIVLTEIKKRDLIFVDSRTSRQSLAYRLATKLGVKSGYNEGFLDAVDDKTAIKNKLKDLVRLAKEKRKIIIIAHPRENTLAVLKEELSSLKKDIEFITVRDYFEL